MKVTVCFGNIKVVVPCGVGDLSVANLQDKACARYRRAVGKGADYHVKIVQLESAVDGGILDIDDLVCDVTEDKEKLIAVFEEEDPYHRDWDYGSITSSEGKNTPHRPSSGRSQLDPHIGSEFRQSYFSPELGEVGSTSERKKNPLEIEVDNNALKTNSRIVVKNKPSNVAYFSNHDNDAAANEILSMRKSAGMYDTRPNLPMNKDHKPTQPQNGHREPRTNRSNSREQLFRRDASARQSMGSGLSESFDDDSSYSASYPSYNHASMSMQNGWNTSNQGSRENSVDRVSPSLPWFYKDSQEISAFSDGNLQAIKVREFIDERSEKFAGLLVASIEKASQISYDDTLHVGDVIVEINDSLLMDFSFNDAEHLLKESLKYPRIELRVLPVEEKERYASYKIPSNNTHIEVTPATPLASTQQMKQNESNLRNSSASVTSQSSPDSFSPKLKTIAQLSIDNVSRYTKKIGKRVSVELRKDVNGLGFTLTTRDTTMGEPGPIYIKTILPRGAAIKDGRLFVGDRLLEVNGENVVGKSQQDVVTMLRNVSIGAMVTIVVSRQTENLPRKLKEDPDTDRVVSDDKMKEYFLFDIALNDTGSAGLGISLKGNQSKKTGKDLGVFVKSVFRGGAAWQDGRLKPNDQLIQVNGHSLRGMSNNEAIDILKTSMSIEGNVRGMIEMVIARRKSNADSSRVSSEASSDMSDLVLDPLTTVSYPATEIACDGDVTTTNKASINDVESYETPTSQHDEHGLDSLKADSPVNPDVIISDEDWLETDDSYEPFSRESTMRHSISEKRRDAVPRFPYSSDNTKKKTKNEDSSPTPPDVVSTPVKKSNGNVGTPSKKKTTPSRSSKNETPHKNNNNSTFEWRIPQSTFQKSISTESLVAAVKKIEEKENSVAHTNSQNAPDVGPYLGIAKSSSLESLQTAVEVAEHNTSMMPIPRPLTKVVRGRVLNDSFRAALDRSYNLSQELPTLKHMETSSTSDVREDDGRTSQNSSNATSSDDNSRTAKKRNKFLGIFKMNKGRKSDGSGKSSKLSENELHKRELEARREKDFERMKEESNRIQAKAREMRKKKEGNKSADDTRSRDTDRSRAPSVSITTTQRAEDNYNKMKTLQTSSGRRSIDPYVTEGQSKYDRTSTEGRSSSPPPVPSRGRRHKADKKLNDSVSAYSSLPRQARREEDSRIEIVSRRTSSQKMDNAEFYHLNKPNSLKKRFDSTATASTLPNSNRVSPDKNSKKNLAAVLKSPSERLASSSKLHHSVPQQYTYRREESPEIPPQSFYVVHSNNFPSQPVVVRRGTIDNSPLQRPHVPSYRHSIYTDQPSALPLFKQTRSPPPGVSPSDVSRRSWLPSHVVDDVTSGDDSSRTDSPSSSEAAERNRKAYYKLMKREQGEGEGSPLGKIEISVPYNL